MFLDGSPTPRGRTPLIISLAPSLRPLRLRLLADGYLPAAAEVTPSSDTRLAVPLVRRPPAAPPRHRRRGPDLEHGATVDPFAE